MAVGAASAATVFTWGENAFGQLGVRAPAKSDVPLALALGEPTRVAAGGHSSYVLDASGELIAWGSNADGAIGQPEGTGRLFTPMPMPGLVGDDVKEISAGHGHALALLANGTVVAWGGNKYGELGDGTTEPSTTPVPVAGLSEVRKVVTSCGTSYAILDDGQLMVWGNGRYGQLGLGSTSDRHEPVPVPGIAHAVQVGAGCIDTIVLTEAGAVYTFGGNEYGQLGHGAKNTRRTDVPGRVIGLPAERIREVAAGLFYNAAVTSSGRLYEWGYDHTGQLGNGTALGGPQGTPRPVVGLPGSVVKVAPAVGAMNIERTSQHTLAIVEGGDLYAWGGNEFGQLGTGSTAAYDATPAQVVGLEGGVTEIAAGGFASLAVGP